MMMEPEKSREIWVFGDLRNKRLFGYSLNVLAKARELAASISGSAALVLAARAGGCPAIENGCDADCVPLSVAGAEAVSHGADRVYAIEAGAGSHPCAGFTAAAVAEAVRLRAPRLVLFPLTDFGRDAAARTARIRNAGLIADCLDLRLENGNVIAACPSRGGEIMAEIGFSENGATGFATVRPNVRRAVEAKGEPGSIEVVRVEGIAGPTGVRLLSRVPEPQARRKLEESEIVVVGGAGLGNTDGFAMVRELASALGGEVGATRPPVLLHWVDEERLIGQTGKTVRPKLLISVGTSGAVQYTAGIAESGLIVAINRDAASPIFQAADLGIVADAKIILPQLNARLRQRSMRILADALCESRTNGGRTGFGARVRKLREDHQLAVEALAEATGQTPEFIAQVESDAVVPSVSFLLRFSAVLKVDPGTFLRQEEKAQIRDRRAQAFLKRTQNYSYQTLSPGAENDHLRAFLVTIEPKQVHKPVSYKHEGEEFNFVLEGELELTLGNKVHHLKPGESMHFNSEIPHKLKSVSNEPTRCLVVLYTV